MGSAIHGECALKAMTYDDLGASCTACGMRWSRDEHGYGIVTIGGRIVGRRRWINAKAVAP